MAENATPEIETGKKKRAFGKILLLGLNGLIFLGGAGFFLLTKMELLNKPAPVQDAKPSTQVVAKADTAQDIPQAPVKHVVFDLPPLVVNLSGDNGQRYLRIGLQLNVKDEKASESIDKSMIPIKNNLIFLLSSKTYKDISTVEGKHQLQQDIKQSLNDTLGNSLIMKTYFREFIVQ